MKKLIYMVMALAMGCWAVSRPMESIENYNVLLIHGAYGSQKGFSADSLLPEAYNAGWALENGATLGGYTNGDRITHWLSSEIFEEPNWENGVNYVRNSYVYNWRSFSKPANSSINNARELGDRRWNSNGVYGKRRALVEEAQEVRAVVKNEGGKICHGQEALEIIRQNSDLYRQLPSRYILIGHSMGGVVSREYVQNSNYYHGEVEKVITLDSPHEGTGALNMQLDLTNIPRVTLEGLTGSITMMSAVAVGAWVAGKDPASLTVAATGLAISMALAAGNLLDGSLLYSAFLENYENSDSLVCYVDPHYEENVNCKYLLKDENINVLKEIYNTPDSLPMFRLMAGKNSLTFTDPKLSVNGLMNFFCS